MKKTIKRSALKKYIQLIVKTEIKELANECFEAIKASLVDLHLTINRETVPGAVESYMLDHEQDLKDLITDAVSEEGREIQNTIESNLEDSIAEEVDSVIGELVRDRLDNYDWGYELNPTLSDLVQEEVGGELSVQEDNINVLNDLLTETIKDVNLIKESLSAVSIPINGELKTAIKNILSAATIQLQ